MPESYRSTKPLNHETHPSLHQDRKNEPFKKGAIKKYERITKDHGRSLENSSISNKVIWGNNFGEYTIIFSARSEKGLPTKKINYKDFFVDEYSTEDKMETLTLMKSDRLERVLKASKLMLSNGLPTENIRDVKLLKSIDGKSIESIKKDAYHNKKKQIKDLNKKKSGNNKLTDEQIEYWSSLTKEGRYCIIERDLPLNERLIDIQNLQFHGDSDDVKKMLKKIFSFINTKNKIFLENSKKPINEQVKYTAIKYPEKELKNKLDYNNPIDIGMYFSQYLPKAMGQYLAKLHNLGLAHGFATNHNWTLDGSLCDCDSVRGAPLMDDEITNKDKFRDLSLSLMSLEISVFGDKEDEDEKESLLKTAIRKFFKSKNINFSDDEMRNIIQYNLVEEYQKYSDINDDDFYKKFEEYILEEANKK